jgi:hypothetical protein
MTSGIDVFISAAEDNAATAQEIANALEAAGITCWTDAGGATASATLAALESCRALVFVSSSSANHAAHVIRALERAASRAVPVITYAIEAAEPSPSIAYFTGTNAPIRAWGTGKSRSQIETLIDACRSALAPGVRLEGQPNLRAPFSRAAYVDSRSLLVVVTIALAGCCLADTYALWQDIPAMVAAPGSTSPPAVAANPAGPSFLGPAATLWTVIIGSILVLRRARLNLAAQFARHVVTGGREIIWRPLVPIANAFWLPRIVTDLWSAAAPDPQSQPRWGLARGWGAALLATYFFLFVRDTLHRSNALSTPAFAAASAALEAASLVLAALTFGVWRTVDARVRRRYLAGRQPVAPAAPPRTTNSEVLLLYEPVDDRVARAVASHLAPLGTRCWAHGAASSELALDGFDAAVVVVSSASHASERMVALVRSALAARIPVVPLVIDPPPVASPLGHYVRSLHWVDGIAGLTSLGRENVGAAFKSERGSRTSAWIDDAGFSRVQPSDPAGLRYRPAKLLRRAARAAAFLQAGVAAALFVIALAIAVFPEGADDPSGNITIALAGSSIPAWALFLAWLRVAHANAVALFATVVGSRRGLLVRTGVPLVNLATGGKALAGLYQSIADRSTPDVVRRASVLRTAWTASGVSWTACALLGWYLGYQGLVRTAMLLSMCQAAATLCRGLIRTQTIEAITSHLDRRARRTATTMV